MIRTVGPALLAAVSLSSALAVPAHASPTAARTGSGPTSLVLSYQRANGGGAVAVTLECPPATTDGHPHPHDTCKALKKAVIPDPDGPAKLTLDADALPGYDTMCTMQYSPVTADITGTWRGKTLSWTHEYGNYCVMLSEAGIVLDF